MRNRRAITLITSPLLALAVLTGCSSEDGDEAGGAGEETSVSASADFNDADVQFATDMIPHHAQALVMVDMTMDREGLSPEFVRLTDEIRAAQAPEIEQMADWLQEWDRPVPETQRDHMNAEGHGDGGHGMDMEGMPGMMTPEDLAQLEGAPGSQFEQRWLEMMIAHHEGAITMAQTELEQGEYADAKQLARGIIDAQRQEIDEMNAMLGR